MNELEKKLQGLALRGPEAHWRREILAECQRDSLKNWREWLWPSPLAWAALAVLWIGCGISNQLDRPEPGTMPAAANGSGKSLLIALQTRDQLKELLSTLRP